MELQGCYCWAEAGSLLMEIPAPRGWAEKGSLRGNCSGAEGQKDESKG